MGNKRSIASVIYYGLSVFVVLLASYLVLALPADFILDLFWEKTGQVQIQNAAYNYGQFAGLPAGMTFRYYRVRNSFTVPTVWNILPSARTLSFHWRHTA